MKLTIDFSPLYKAIAPLGAVVTSFTITKRSDSIQDVARDLVKGKVLGEDIELDEIDGSNGVLIYEGYQVMLYIPDQGNAIDSALVDGKGKGVKRVHVAECRTIIEMRDKGRFHNRYVVTSRIDGKFSVFGQSYTSSKTLEGESDLSPCINCMKELNVEGYLERGIKIKEISLLASRMADCLSHTVLTLKLCRLHQPIITAVGIHLTGLLSHPTYVTSLIIPVNIVGYFLKITKSYFMPITLMGIKQITKEKTLEHYALTVIRNSLIMVICTLAMKTLWLLTGLD